MTGRSKFAHDHHRRLVDHLARYYLAPDVRRDEPGCQQRWLLTSTASVDSVAERR